MFDIWQFSEKASTGLHTWSGCGISGLWDPWYKKLEQVEWECLIQFGVTCSETVITEPMLPLTKWLISSAVTNKRHSQRHWPLPSISFPVFTVPIPWIFSLVGEYCCIHQNMVCGCDLALHTSIQIRASSARRKEDYSRKNGLLWIALQELGTIPGKSSTFQWALPVSFGCSSKAFHGILTMHASGDCFCQNFALKSHSLNTLRLVKEILIF